jgi:hypothetical protein
MKEMANPLLIKRQPFDEIRVSHKSEGVTLINLASATGLGALAGKTPKVCCVN